MCISMLPSCMFYEPCAFLVPMKAKKKELNSLGLELQATVCVNHGVGTENQTWALCRSSNCRASSPVLLFISLYVCIVECTQVAPDALWEGNMCRRGGGNDYVT